jgi:alcohol dehydrogenase
MPFFSYPRIPGHELGVEVVEVGAGVDRVRPGDRCAVEPYLNCGTCRACQRGRPNCCVDLRVLGVHVDGGLRALIIVPADKLHRSSRLTAEQLALVETLVIGRHAVGRAAAGGDDRLLVVGAGPIGLAVLAAAQLAGAQAAVLDLDQRRLEFCRDTLRVTTIVGGAEALERIRECTGGDGFDVVVDATGDAAAMAGSLQYAAHGGRVVFVGITADPIRFAHRTLHAPELTLSASRNALPDDFASVIRAIEDGRLDTTPWITHRVPLAGLIDALPRYAQPGSGVVKAMVELD